MNKELEDALNYDPLHEAEKISGKSYKEDDSVAWLAMLLGQSQAEKKNALLFLNRDTSFDKTLTQNIEAIEEMGFSLALQGNVKGTLDKWRIYWRTGVLIFFDSFNGDTTLNSGHAYLNFHGQRGNLNRGSNGHVGYINGESVWDCSVDIREGLKHFLDNLTNTGKILEKWMSPPFMWLLDYQETKVENVDYKAVNKSKIERLPASIREAIGL